MVPITIDSGAVDTVGPTKVGEGFPITPTRESMMGIGFRAANGTPIKNHGERVIEGSTQGGQSLIMRITVADVSNVLAPVSNICECGNKVVFDEEGSYIQDKRTGVKTEVHKRNGVYVIDMKLRKDRGDGLAGIAKDSEGVFMGQGTDLI